MDSNVSPVSLQNARLGSRESLDGLGPLHKSGYRPSAGHFRPQQMPRFHRHRAPCLASCEALLCAQIPRPLPGANIRSPRKCRLRQTDHGGGASRCAASFGCPRDHQWRSGSAGSAVPQPRSKPCNSIRLGTGVNWIDPPTRLAIIGVPGTRPIASRIAWGMTTWYFGESEVGLREVDFISIFYRKTIFIDHTPDQTRSAHRVRPPPPAASLHLGMAQPHTARSPGRTLRHESNT